MCMTVLYSHSFPFFDLFICCVCVRIIYLSDVFCLCACEVLLWKSFYCSDFTPLDIQTADVRGKDVQCTRVHPYRVSDRHILTVGGAGMTCYAWVQ